MSKQEHRPTAVSRLPKASLEFVACGFRMAIPVGDVLVEVAQVNLDFLGGDFGNQEGQRIRDLE